MQELHRMVQFLVGRHPGERELAAESCTIKRVRQLTFSTIVEAMHKPRLI